MIQERNSRGALKITSEITTELNEFRADRKYVIFYKHVGLF